MLQKFLDQLAEKIAEKVADKLAAVITTQISGVEQNLANTVEGFVKTLEQELAGIPIIGGVFKGQSS